MSESSSTSVCNATKIADFFVTEYYSRLKKDPSTLYELYHDSGCLTWVGNRGDSLLNNLSAPQSIIRAESKERIRSAIKLLDLKNCTTYVEVLECSKSINNSLCITAKGVMYSNDGNENVARGFVQNFLLTEIRPRWYFVRNDCLIFLDSKLPLLESAQYSTRKHADIEVSKSVNKKSTNLGVGDLNALEENNPQREQHGNFNSTAMCDVRQNDESLVENSSNSSSSSHVNNHESKNQSSSKKESASEVIMKSLNGSGDNKDNSDNALTNTSETSLKYEVTSYAGKLMENGIKNSNAKAKGYVIPVSHENKSKMPETTQQNQIKKNNNYQKELKNKRKVFVHSIPSNVSDEQIKDAVQIQLKVHGGGYAIDVERPKVPGKQWGIIELDSEVSCRALLANGLYLGGMEIPIEKWKQMQHNSTSGSSGRFGHRNNYQTNSNNSTSRH